jgi:hypothetical protein
LAGVFFEEAAGLWRPEATAGIAVAEHGAAVTLDTELFALGKTNV